MIFIQKNTIKTEKDSVISITSAIKDCIQNSGINNGIVVIESLDPATGIIKLPEKAELSKLDLVNDVRRLVPARIDFNYKESAKAAAGNIRSALFNSTATLIINDGAFAAEAMGVFFMEYDGPGTHHYTVMVFGE